MVDFCGPFERSYQWHLLKRLHNRCRVGEARCVAAQRLVGYAKEANPPYISAQARAILLTDVSVISSWLQCAFDALSGIEITHGRDLIQ